MNNVRWQVTFKTIKNKTAVVYIGDSTYTGSPIDIEPAANTISIDAVSEHLYDPVRTETGYLRVIDNGDLTDIMPVGAMDRPVELYVDGGLCWRGYITPATYTSAWDITPKEQEIPLQSALSVLSAVRVEEGKVLTNIADLLLEILDSTGYDDFSCYIPRIMTGVGSRVGLPCAELYMQVNRYNWLTASTTNPEDADYTILEGRSYLDMLQDICQYFGWQAVQHGPVIVMLSNVMSIDRYYALDRNQLRQVANYPNLSLNVSQIPVITLSEENLEYDSINHTYSIEPGKRKVVVTAHSNVSDIVVPHLTFAGKPKYSDTHAIGHGINTRNVVLEIPTDMTFYRWDKGVAVPYQYPASRNDMASFSTAQMILNDTYAEFNRTNYNLNEYLRIRLDGNFRILKVAEIISHSAGAYPVGSALCLSLNINSSYVKYNSLGNDIDDIGLSAWGPGNCYLNISVGIGNSWWNGSSWIDIADGEQPPIVNIYAGVEEGSYDWATAPQTTGRLANTKTIDDPYPGADGYLMKVDRLLTGKTKIIFYHYNYSDTFKPAHPRAIFLSNIALQYYSGYDNNQSDQLRFSALTGYTGRDELSISLAMSAKRQSKAGQGTIYFGDMPISNDNQPTYADGATELPEQHLLGGLTDMVSSSVRRMEIGVEWNSLHPTQRIQLEGKTYLIQGMKTDIHHESTTLILASYGED